MKKQKQSNGNLSAGEFKGNLFFSWESKGTPPMPGALFPGGSGIGGGYP